MLKGFGVALLCVLPLYLLFPVFGNLNTDVTFSVIYGRAILTGFKEELVFRAFMFGLLFRYAKTGHDLVSDSLPANALTETEQNKKALHIIDT